MTAAINMPRMGETMEEGRIAAWLKKPGDAFKRGEIIVEIETDKTVVEAPALADGTLIEILAGEGATVAVGEPIGRYRPVRDIAVAEASSAAAPETSAPAEPAAAPLARPAAVAQPSTSRPRATPLARSLARAQGVDLASVIGTGRRARIEGSDVEAASGRASPPATARAATPEPSFVGLPGGRMAYREWSLEGARQTVLFLHGFGADGATWSGFLSGLARAGSRVIAPDLPSHGATSVDAVDMEGLVSAVADFVVALGLADCEIVAHSMGAAVAARASAEARLRPSRLTLVAPAGVGSEIDADFINGVADVTSGGALSHLLRRLSSKSPPVSRAQLDAMAAQLAQGRLKPLARALVDGVRQGVDILPDLRALAAPCRVVWGASDAIAPWTQVAHLPAKVAIHLIAGAGHMPAWDNPQEFASLFD